MDIQIRDEITYELRQNALDLLYLIHEDSLELTYENQEHILEFLKLLFSSKFRERIIKLRTELDIPKEWSRKNRDDTDEWENWVDSHSEAPKERTDKLVLELCAEFKVDPLSFGLFIIDYLYFSAVDSETIKLSNSFPRGEFKYKVKIISGTDLLLDRDNNKDQQNSLYFQIFKNTSRTGIEKFFSLNETEIFKIQEQLPEYPVLRVRSVKIFKREVEILLFDSLGFSAKEIGEILNGNLRKELNYNIRTEFIDNFMKMNKRYFSELSSLMSSELVIDNICERVQDEICSLGDSEISAIVSKFKKELNISKVKI